jgi:type IV pilus assembly protein PilO
MKKIKLQIPSLKNLNPKEVYKWPLKAQMIVGVFVTIITLIAGLAFVVSGEYSDLNDAIEKENKLKSEFIDKTKQSVNLDLYKKQLDEITKDSDTLLKQLPNRSEIEKLLIDINQTGVNRGLQFELFKPNRENITEYYAELPISIKVTGTYNSIGNFAADLSQLPRVVILKDINLTTNTSGTITMNATAETFRYLDQEEIDKQKQEKIEKMKKENGVKKEKKNDETK